MEDCAQVESGRFHGTHRWWLINSADENDPTPLAATTRVNGPADLAQARQFVADAASCVGLDADRIQRLSIAVSEAATNAITHGSGSGTLTITRTATTLTVAVRDSGAGLTSPPNPAPPHPSELRGRGLWLARQLCDRVEINTSTSGTTVRLTMSL